MPSTNPCFLEGYLPKTRLCEASSQEKDYFKKKTKHVDGESFQIHKKTENRAIDPFANPPELTVIHILPHELCEKDTVIGGGDTYTGSSPLSLS